MLGRGRSWIRAVGSSIAERFTRRENARYTIGIYEGSSPLDLRPAGVRNPVLTANDITDVAAKFVADPFMVSDSGVWHMFFEVVTHQREKKIGVATSVDAMAWQYKQIVLQESFDLSYPYVFRSDNAHYMVPEAAKSGSVRLYEASGFPTRWRFVATLIDEPLVDPSLIEYQGRWWLFAAAGTSDTLFLYFADKLTGPWTQHPMSPVVRHNPHAARSGGRLTIHDGRLLRFAQDDFTSYGYQVHAFHVQTLTPTAYEEMAVPENPIIKASGLGWNAKKMHTVDPHQVGPHKWIACVDGFGWSDASRRA